MKQKNFNLVKVIYLLLIPFFCFYALEYYTHDPWKMDICPQIINYLLFLLVLVLFLFITGNRLFSIMILVIISAVTGIANYFVMAFRNNPILPWDLKSASTAMVVADNYEFDTDLRFYISCAVLLLVLLSAIAAAFIIRKKPAQRLKLRTRITVIIADIFLILLISFGMMNPIVTNELLTPTNLFTQWASYRDNGFMVSFLQNLQYMRIKKPAGYNADNLDSELSEFISSYKKEHPESSLFSEETLSEQSPDLIVIMNESFSDLSVLHDFATDKDYMPYIHSLQKTDSSNLITGNLFVSVCGGNTANTEFEFLTGNTTAFLPSGSIPYQQYLSEPITSLASELSDLGYTSVGLHPYNAGGWNRDKVYPLMGFDETCFKTDFHFPKIIRKYISDQTAYEKLEELSESNQTASSFLFEVTMQNHGGYTEIFDNFPIQVHLTDIQSSTNAGTENYLTLIKESDAQFKALIEYYKKSEKPVIVVMFGDHQPNDYVSEKIAALTGVKKENRSLEELQNRYIVPYVIWANFDLNKETAGLYELSDITEESNVNENTLSPNYLGACLMRLSGNETSDYQDFLLILKETYPVITANVVIDNKGNYLTLSEAKKQQPELMGLYEKLQYRELFDQ